MSESTCTTSTRKRWLVPAVLAGACLGSPIRAWSGPDLCQGQSTYNSEQASFTLTSMTVDNISQPIPVGDAGTTGTLTSADNNGNALTILPRNVSTRLRQQVREFYEPIAACKGTAARLGSSATVEASSGLMCTAAGGSATRGGPLGKRSGCATCAASRAA